MKVYIIKKCVCYDDSSNFQILCVCDKGSLKLNFEKQKLIAYEQEIKKNYDPKVIKESDNVYIINNKYYEETILSVEEYELI
ncbi:MAG: hypothetical protein E6356_14140 [Terrisporobacter othiniensis]|nr:hypothetical protein [Terrisporobacter othiniensis]